MGKHRATRPSLWERAWENVHYELTEITEDVWQGVAIMIGFILVMAVGIYLVLVSDWWWA